METLIAIVLSFFEFVILVLLDLLFLSRDRLALQNLGYSQGSFDEAHNIRTDNGLDLERQILFDEIVSCSDDAEVIVRSEANSFNLSI